MFTGIVTDIGRIIALEQKGDLRARIATSYEVDGIDLGASIACDGVCLTVVQTGSDDASGWFDVEISAESVSKTAISQGRRAWAVGSRVNLERALRMGDELGGHLVSGHVDGVAEITQITPDGDSTRVTLNAPADLARFVAEKGSVTLIGASLTVNEVDGTRFGINLIPHTKQVTTWGDIETGDMVNLEIDTLARYVARLAEMRES